MRNRSAPLFGKKIVLKIISVILVIIMDFLITVGITVIFDGRSFVKLSGSNDFNDLFFTNNENDNFYFIRRWCIQNGDEGEIIDPSIIGNAKYESISAVKGVVASILYRPSKRLATIIIDKRNTYDHFDEDDIATAKNTSGYITYADIFKFGSKLYMYALFKSDIDFDQNAVTNSDLTDILFESEKSIGFFEVKDFDLTNIVLADKSYYNDKAYPYWYGDLKNRAELKLAVVIFVVFQLLCISYIFKKAKIFH